jgi:hypothetical protein
MTKENDSTSGLMLMEVESCCALRFAGYEYESESPDDRSLELNRPVIDQLLFHEKVEDNMLVFFRLQRFLCKWGGERLTEYSDERIAFDHLFLRLYREPVPEEYRHPEYCEEWQEKHFDQAEAVAAQIRNSFKRKGEGPTIR